MNPTDDTVTLAVLGERMSTLTGAVEKLTESVEKLGVLAGKVSNIEGRLQVLEQWHTWLLRTVFGVVVLAVLGAVFTGARAVAG